MYRLPSSSSCSVVEAVSSNIDKALILQHSANIMVPCGDSNVHNTEWLSHSKLLMLHVCFAMASPKLKISQAYLLDLFLCSNPDSGTVASHPPLGKSDHMVVGVDVKFVVKSTNEHPYHHPPAIYDLDASKATGPDRIPAIALKMCSPELSLFLAKLYNKCLAESCFPSCWKSS